MNETPTLLTVTERTIDLLHPRPEDVCIFDLGHGLGMEPRFACQVTERYSVAEHSVKGLPILHDLYTPAVDEPWPRLKLRYLLHDATEAYLKDIPGPLKHWDGMLGYQVLEHRHHEAIHAAFQLHKDELADSRVKVVDKKMYAVENWALRSRGDKPHAAYKIELNYWGWREARKTWIHAVVDTLKEIYSQEDLKEMRDNGLIDEHTIEMTGLSLP